MYKEFSCPHKQEQKIYTKWKNTTLIDLNVLTVRPLSGFSFTLWFVSNKGCTLAFHHLFFPIDYKEQGRVHTYTSEVIWLYREKQRRNIIKTLYLLHLL